MKRSVGLRTLFVAVACLSPVALFSCAGQPGVPYSMRSWTRPFAPYRVIGNIYYVGSTGIAQFLITTPAGHILIDSGFESSVPRVRANVEKLGFRFDDIKILVASHAHIDHVQGHALVRQLTHAQVVVSAPDAAVVAAGGKGEPVFDGVYAWTPCPVDRVIADGEQVTLGGTTLTAHLTPGHTKGATTWTMPVTAQEQTLAVVFFPSANINPGVHLVGNTRYPNIADDFERSFAIWKSLPCDVFLGAHGSFFEMQDKFSRRDTEARNPFIDPDGYRRFVAEAEARFKAQLQSER